MKYELTDETIEHQGRTLRRIRALRAVPYVVRAGELGGYVETGDNLSQEDSCWVYPKAKVWGKAVVSGTAKVTGEAQVFHYAEVNGMAMVTGCAKVFGQATVTDRAVVDGFAQVGDHAWVGHDVRVRERSLVNGRVNLSGYAHFCGDARVQMDSDWLSLGPAKSSGRFTTAHFDPVLGVRVNCGCFSGTVAQFSAEIEDTHKHSVKFLEQYRLFCQLIATNFGVKA